MSAGFGLTRNVARTLRGTYAYRYTLYDTNGNEISDPENNHILIRSEVEAEWDTPFNVRHRERSENLLYQGGDLVFGPSASGWSGIAHVGVEVDFGSGFDHLGAFEVDGGSGFSVSEGDSLRLEADENELVIDFTSSSRRPPNYTSSELPGVWEAFVRGVRDDAVWGFTLVTDQGSHDTVTKFDVSWEVSSSGIIYRGDEIVWRPFQSSQTEDNISVYIGGPSITSELVGEANISTVEDQSGNTVSVASGDVPVADSGDFELTIS